MSNISIVIPVFDIVYAIRKRRKDILNRFFSLNKNNSIKSGEIQWV